MLLRKALLKFTTNIKASRLLCTSNLPGSDSLASIYFTHEEKQRILHILNKTNAEDLSRLNVTKTRIQNLEQWKEVQGPFKSFQDVLNVQGFNETVFKKLCDTIINQTDDNGQVKINNNNSRKGRQFLTPLLSNEETNKLKSAVGIHISPTGASWAKIITTQNTLDQWGYNLFTDLPKKMTPIDTFELVLAMMKQIPEGDAYIFESVVNLSPQGQTQIGLVASFTQQLEIMSMMLALLNTSQKHNPVILDSEENSVNCPINKVYYMRAKLAARLFRTLVGNEKVSTISIVSNLLNGTTSDLEMPCSKISVSEEIKSVYNEETPILKELLGQSLTLAITFMDLCVYKTQKSLVAVTQKKSSKKS